MSCTQLLCGDTHQCLTASCTDFRAASSHRYFRESRFLMAPHGIFRVGKVVMGWFGAMEQEEAALSLSLLSCPLVLLWLFHLPANKTTLPKLLERLMWEHSVPSQLNSYSVCWVPLLSRTRNIFTTPYTGFNSMSLFHVQKPYKKCCRGG